MIIQSSCLAKGLYLLLKLLTMIITYLHKTACALKNVFNGYSFSEYLY